MTERVRKPEWLKISIGANERYTETKRIVESHCLHTICSSGRCPNMGECWGRGTATFMIGGDICTRCCKFCNTQTGKPMPLDPKEPVHVAESIALMKLSHAVVTSVDRDDLPDLGAAHWAQTIREIKRLNPETTVEVLIPDFQGRKELANGVIAINIVEGDEVVDVRLTNGHNELILANRNGRAVRFDENQIRTMGRTSTGVRGMRLDEGDDALIGMIVVNDPEKETVMVVSEQGYGKRSDVVDYRVTNRGGKGVKTLNITEKTGRLVAIKNVTDENDLMIINQSGIVIRLAVADCRVMGRATQGVRLINLTKKNDVIASVCKVMSSELEASVEEESRSAWAKKSEEIENDTVGAKTAEEVVEAETELENQEDENVQE